MTALRHLGRRFDIPVVGLDLDGIPALPATVDHADEEELEPGDTTIELGLAESGEWVPCIYTEPKPD